MISYPKPLVQGSKIALVSLSSPVSKNFTARFELALSHVRNMGYEVIEGKYLRGEKLACRNHIINEFMEFWQSDDIKAIVPPWGGELSIRLLEKINFETIKEYSPKWMFGFSDVSTLMFPLTLCADIATIHGSNFMDIIPKQNDPLTAALLNILKMEVGSTITQYSSTSYQPSWPDIASNIHEPFLTTAQTNWFVLDDKKTPSEFSISGRIIGGCLDTISHLVGTPYGNIDLWRQRSESEGLILFFENAEMGADELTRVLWQLKYARWFNAVSGIVFGRSSAVRSECDKALHLAGIRSVLSDLALPVIMDADIGHQPPQLNIINGSFCEIFYNKGAAMVAQTLI